ncbi:MAG TPA: hypothetical protein VHE83_00860 [Mycobacteriales bacterium]|nr:hypothetical protein [Mycobacteriales bacterium]
MTHSAPTTLPPLPDLATFDIYREVHKGLRAELFGLVTAAGALDVDDAAARARFVTRFARVDDMLGLHHGHEDGGALDECIAKHAPHLLAPLHEAHRRFVGEIAILREIVIGLQTAADAAELYDRAIAFVVSYLGHMRFEEHEVMPALRAAATIEELFAVEMSIRTSMLPETMVLFMRAMLPAMNSDERTAMLGAMKAGAPAEAFALFWATAAEVLSPEDLDVVARRIDGLVEA